MDDAYTLGIQSFILGDDICSNPFNVNTKQHSDWAMGWLDEELNSLTTED